MTSLLSPPGGEHDTAALAGFSYPGVRFTEQGLALPQGLPFGEWQQIGHMLHAIDRSIQWAIGDWIRYGEHEYGEMYSQEMQEQTGYTGPSLRNIKYVAERIEPSLRDDRLSWSHYRFIAPLVDRAPEAAQRVVQQAIEGEWSVREVQVEVREQIKDIERGERIRELQRNANPHRPKYPLLYADPPWPPDYTEAEARVLGQPYTAATIAQLLEAPVQDTAADDSVIFLRCPNPHLPSGIRMLEAWGFEYRTAITVHNFTEQCAPLTGNYTGCVSYLLLIGKRGNVPHPPRESRPPSVISVAGHQHAVAPAEIYDMMEAMYPDVPRIVLFDYPTKRGWDRWGAGIAA